MQRLVVGLVAAGLMLAGCSSSQKTESGNSIQPTSFPAYVSVCDNGNRLYFISMPYSADTTLIAPHDSTCAPTS